MKIILIITLSIFCCSLAGQEFATANSEKNGLVRYEIDHLIVFVTDTTIQTAFDKIFTRADKLETRHSSQGTRGVYYLFLNSFIELLYLEDSVEAYRNQERFGSEYFKRWDSNQGFSNIGFVLRLMPFDTTRINYDFDIYNSADNPENEFYVMLSGNKEIKQPMTAITMPHRQQKVFQTVDDAVTSANPEIRDDLRSYLSHQTGIQRLSGIELHTNLRGELQNLDILSSIENLNIINDVNNQIIIIFDHNQQSETIKLKNNRVLIEVRY
jgi:hypothetical protein